MPVILKALSVHIPAALGWLLILRIVWRRPGMLLYLGAFGAGALATLPAGIFNSVFEFSLLGQSDVFGWRNFFLFFGIVGPVEEALKFLAFFLVILKQDRFQTSMDGMVLALAVCFGFACAENIFYALQYGVANTAFRVITGPLAHGSFGIFWGYALGAVLHEDADGQLLLATLLLAATLHGTYNYLLTVSFTGALLNLLFFLLLNLAMVYLLRTEKARAKTMSAK